MTHLSRRSLAKLGMAAGTIAALTPKRAWGAALEPSPDFALDDDRRYVAGLRPYRDGTFRLESESIGERLLVHNYGHGGAGITMSWGVALEVRDLVEAWRQESGHDVRRVAVLGAGAIGLTAATVLVEAGYQVTVYAKGFLDETTSSVAGGQFAPSTVAFHNDSDGTSRFQRILRRSFRAHEAKIGQGFGVVRRRNYTWNRSHSFGLVPRDVIAEPVALTPLPFVGHELRSGFCYQTLLIEPPIFLRRMELDLRLAGVRFIRKAFESVDHMLTLEPSILVNCMGLGAGAVLNDAAVVPVRGQLVLLKPQAQLEYLYGGTGYIFPRSDWVVVGGSFERGESDPTPNPVMCAEILAQARAPFESRLRSRVAPVPRWMTSES